ncbi:unnamed protein product (macronuclear) [Paramecium tetraurelia]|uniref:Uncharacterized protein n=1 Tax=Paramecium tetraurelia TaxID=5888 RepID=A0BRV3_PARTE|nr:uncharacterized protein GSPATT00031501001 [Paramecium tetraurelia]CAK61270.1 unnamed protein product [Paramecium tetraurelia]|eukprot:XP_001428668.1 hypothetical protein (macronuclear) [Paramecium tetraurelia strain d4-2]
MKLNLAILLILLLAVAQARRVQFLGHRQEDETGKENGEENQGNGEEGQGNGEEGQGNGEEGQGNGEEGQGNGEEGQGNGGEDSGQSGNGDEGSDNGGSCSNGGTTGGQSEPVEQQTCKGVIFDAGSSGTRVFVYTWPCRLFHYANPEIEITQQAPSVKVNPGISQFGDNIAGIKDYLQPLLDFANEHVEEEIRHRTPILLGATAGMRILDWGQQYDVMEEVRRILRESGYLFENSDWARIISGKDEGAYLWLSVNYLKGYFANSNIDEQGKLRESYTTIDIGGASTQLADEITEQDQYYLSYDDEYGTDYHTFDTTVYNISLYSHSWLYFGQDQARIQINKFLHNLHKRSASFENPCYLKGYKDKFNDEVEVVGTGNPNDCKDLIDLYLIGFNSTCDQCNIQEAYIPKISPESKVYAAGSADFVSKLFNDDNDYTWTQLEYFDEFCTKEFDENNKNKFYATQCFLGLYVEELFAVGYRVPSDTLIETGKINGVEPSWTLAAMFDQIDDNEPCSDSPNCNLRRHMKQWRKDSFHPSMKEHKGRAPLSKLTP